MNLKQGFFYRLSACFYQIASNLIVLAKPQMRNSMKDFWGYVSLQIEKNLPPRFEQQSRQMVENVLGLQDTIVREVMVPRTELAAVRVSDSMDKAISLIREKGRSRIPVFENKIDNIVGVIYAKDILRLTTESSNREIPLEKVMRPAHFVPETKNVLDLLQEMRVKKVHLAIVIDEYGGTAGIVTLEDLIEQIIGEVQDEYDREEERVVPLGQDLWKVDAKIPLEELTEALGIALPEEEEYDTLAGFILYRLGHIPKHKEKLDFEEWSFVVTEVNEKSIEAVKIMKKQLARDERDDQSKEEENKSNDKS